MPRFGSGYRREAEEPSDTSGGDSDRDAEDDFDPENNIGEHASAVSETVQELADMLKTAMKSVSADQHGSWARDSTKFSSNIIDRRLVMKFRGSIQQFQASEEFTFWRMEDENAWMSKTRYTKNVQKPSETRQGDIRNAILHILDCESYDNGFPCDLSLDFPDIYHARGNTYFSSGYRCALFMYKNCHSDKKQCMVIESPYVHSKYLEEYGGYTPDRIGTKGILKEEGSKVTLVKEGHPIIEYLKGVQNVSSSLEKSLDMGWYKLSDSLFNKAKRELSTDLTNNLPLVNFTTFKSRISRPSVKWDEEDELCDNLDEFQSLAVKTNIYTATVVVRIRYQFM